MQRPTTGLSEASIGRSMDFLYPELPWTPGSDFSGVVESTGEDVTRFSIGECAPQRRGPPGYDGCYRRAQ